MVNNPIIVEETLNSSKKEIWDAITKPEKMKRWFFENIPDFKAEPGFKTQFPVDSNGKTFTHLWEIIEIIPEQRISYKWEYQEYPGSGRVDFDIYEKESSIQLIVTATGMETFPSDIPEFSRESCEMGWKYFINGRLKDFLT